LRPRRRILFVSWRDLAHPQAGGSEVLIDRLACGCLERGHEVALMCGAPAQPRRYDVVALGGTYAQYVRAPARYARRFRGWDVLVDNENGIPFFSPLWRRGPVVCLVHHVHRDQWRLRFPPPVAAVGRTLEGHAMPAVYRRSLFLCVSRSTAAAVEGLGVEPERIRVLTMGADPADAAPSERSRTPLFVALGRLVPHKRLDLLLAIWERVRPRVGGRLVVIGDGPERARIERLAGEGVELRGRVTEAEKRTLLREAWLLVHAAMHEGWGMVVFEAAAAGTPTLAFDAPGLRDAIRNATTGVLATCADDFARQWIALAHDPQRRALLGEAARRHVEQVPWSATVDAFLAVLDDAVERHGNGQAVAA
jgi:glycosyltransferase involved in cell wall biosynthesis